MKSFKFGGFLIAAFILAWVFNYKTYNKSPEEKRDEDISILKKAFMESSFELFGPSVDTQKIGDCSAIDIYKLIEFSPRQLSIFRKDGISGLRPDLIDSIQIAYAKCITTNIIDTNYRMKLSPMVESRMRIKLKEQMKETALDANKDLDSLCDCLISKINGMTVKQYMSGYSTTPEFPINVRNCLDKLSK